MLVLGALSLLRALLFFYLFHQQQVIFLRGHFHNRLDVFHYLLRCGMIEDALR